MKQTLQKYIGYLLVSALLLTLFLTKALGQFEYVAQDRLYRDFGIIHPDIFVFGIDEETLIEFGPLQFWSRQIMADAIDILNSEPGWEPAVIAVDMIYSGESNDPAADEALVMAAAELGNVVFGAAISLDYRGDVRTFEKPFPELEYVSSYGILNTIIDPDGVVRRTELSPVFFGNHEPTFAEAIYKAFTGEDVEIPPGMSNPMRLVFTGRPGDYFGAVGFGTSFRDIFADDFDPAFFADSIVLIGPYAYGLMDSYFTATDPGTPMHGVEIHANILQMFLDGYFKSYAPGWVNIAIIIFTLLLFSFVFMQVDIRLSFLILVVFMFGYVFINYQLYQAGWITTLIYPVISAVVLFIFALVYRFISDKFAHITAIAEINEKHYAETKELFNSFVKVMTAAIDERTPYNANHSIHVADYTGALVRFLRGKFEPGSPFHMDENREEQLVMAAYLHDVGKIVTPLEVMDKPSRLGNKISVIMQRFEIKKLYDKVMFLSGNMKQDRYDELVEYLNDTLTFIERINTAGFLPDEDIARVKTLSDIVYEDNDGNTLPVFDEDDIVSLSTRKGTLTDAERGIMEEHASVTERLLGNMKFSEDLADVPNWAKSHHEFIDGTGYPYKAANEEVPVEVRILTMLDIYDALTARDRPYKKAAPHDVAIKILRSMVDEGKLDGELVELFIESGIGI
ncbi:MAG: CHASE2 domain-containing protein [Oscillospiraceae bacterium]|nr:CHASE2 domain-containing protein [Oscillospiraceae bacterium]